MPTNLADLLGDGDGAGNTRFRVVRPVTGSVVVAREGETVLLTIGNVGPIRLRYKTAITEGQRLMLRASEAKLSLVERDRRTWMRVGTMQTKVWFKSADAHKIGHWLLVKGTEAKMLLGDEKRITVER